MRRRHVITAATLAAVLFLVISALLARALSVGGAESAAVRNLVTAEAQGGAASVIRLIDGCASAPACRARAAALAAQLRHPGPVSIIQITGGSTIALSGATRTARVVWLAGSSLPRVQCVRVRDAGDVLQGFRVEVLRVSARIRTDAACPSRF